MVASVFHVGKSFSNSKANTEMRTAFHKGVQKLLVY